MRYLWVDAGNDPNYVTGNRHGIDGYFMPLADSRTTQAKLIEIKFRGYAAGVYVGHGWWQPLSATALVEKVWTEFLKVRVPALRLQVNMEQHDPDYIIDVLEGLRAKSATLPLSWTMEGMQGGWASSIAARVVAAKVRAVPQGFWGADGQIEGDWAEDAVLRDLTKAGYPESSVSLFYDAENLPRGWQGYAFTQGRLP